MKDILQTLKFDSIFYDAISNKTDVPKLATLRLGIKSKYHLGAVTLDFGNKTLVGVITGMRLTTFKHLTLTDAVEDGFHSIKELKNALKSYYPEINDESILTQIKFAVLEDQEYDETD